VAAVLVQRAVVLAHARAISAPAAPEAPSRAEREKGARVAAGPATPTPSEGARPPGAGSGEGGATAHPVRVTVNGRLHVGAVEARQTLADFLRDDLGLTGTHLGCEHGVCGACTIALDGQPVRACLLLAVQADGASLRTVEGLAGPEGLSPLQDALREHHGLQCGFCTPGVLMTLEAFLAEAPDPTETQVREALAGNLCRCTGYQGIVAAALAVAAGRRRRAEEARR
jgi:carbon-monoxide dehydrogenase small subunit